MAPPRIPVKGRLLERAVFLENGCWIYGGSKTSDGYGVLGVGRGKQVRAHRASYETFIGSIPAGMLVCHKCDVPLCINPDHLFLGTPKDNTRDMVKKGRKHLTIGLSHPNAKLSDTDVVSIRRLRSRGWKLADIAERFSVSFQYVSAISKGISRGTAKP